MTLEDKVRIWRENPCKFVHDQFHVDLDAWQEEALMEIGGEDLKPRRRVAMKACTGPGKSAVLAWAGWYRMACFASKEGFPKGAALSGEGRDNLRDNLWSEMFKWQQRSDLLMTQFEWTREQIRHKRHTDWFMSARSYPKNANADEIGRSMSGLHSPYPFMLLDETGGMPLQVGQKAEQIFTGGTLDGIVMQAGNPTSTTGLLYHSCTNDRDRTKVITITADPEDPRRTTRVDPEHAREQIEKYGRDNPWVMATILGEFPPGGINTLISLEAVEAATKRKVAPEHYEFGQKRLGVDVARFGDDRCFDDQTEILTNEGWKLFEHLRGDEKVMSIENDKASYEDILHVHKAPFDGELNYFSNKSIDFAVTDNHRMYVRRNPKSAEYKFTPFKDLPQEFVVREDNGWSGKNPLRKSFDNKKAMPNGGYAEYKDEFSFHDWASFLGWFVSEGNVYHEKREAGRYRVILTQYPGEKRDGLECLLTRMNISWRACSNGTQLEFSNKEMAMYLMDQCGSGASNKRVPREIKDADEKSIQLFLDSFLLGDGTKRKDGNGRCYITSSSQLADDIQEMLSKVGKAGMLRLKEKKGSKFEIEGREVTRNNDTYVIYERSHSVGKHIDKREVTRSAYKGFVWCVATKFESIFVRRNGKTMWSGNTVIFPRQGLQAHRFVEMRGARSNDIAARVIQAKTKWGSETEYVDGTGGYGSGVVDYMIQGGHSPVEVAFSGKAINPKYHNKRAEMWFEMAEWILRGGSIPDDPQLIKELTAPTYTYTTAGKMLLEPKDQIKDRLGFSPDVADALALTFAHPEMPMRTELDYLREKHMGGSRGSGAKTDFDPFKY